MYRRLLPLVFLGACVAPGEDETTSSVINARTVISLSFDDTLADQFQVGDLAAARGMRVTFFVNSPRFGQSGYMTKAQVVALEQQGHEIGGHTLDHANLPTLSDADARTEVCNDRAALLAQGFRVTSFAYPFGADNTTDQNIVRDCGYNSARDVGGLASTTYTSCQGCPWTNPVPPTNLYEIRTNDSIHVDTTLQTMEQYVIDAENHGGGYVPMVFHHVCDGCNQDSVTAANLAAFLDWLQQRAPATQVGTIDQEIGGSVKPAVTYPATVTTTNLAKNPSLETDANGDQVPDCWQRGGYGTNSSTYTLLTSGAYDGTRAQRIQITSYSSGGRRLVTAQDSGTCAPAAVAGHHYTMTAYYTANVAPRFTAYYRSSSGTWTYLSESPSLPTSSTYRQATYTTPAIPAGATHVSIGLTIYAVGTITMDAFTLVDADATSSGTTDTTPPSAQIFCNGTACSPNAYPSTVSVSLAGWDFSGIRSIRYTTNGSDPATSGTTYSTPFNVSTTTTVRALITDNANNTTTLSRTIRVAADTTPPTLSITCNGTTCTTTPYTDQATISLDAADASGIASIRYTTDGRDPASFGTTYTGPFTITATTTVRAIATDNAGNVKTLSQTVQITASDTTPPTLSIACNTEPCTSTAYGAPVSVTLSAADASGIREVRYTTDGSDPAISGTLYTAAFTVSSTSTVRAIATDNAGNTATLSQAITITTADTTPPTLTIACNATTCTSSTYASPVSVSLTSTDASGIRDIRYTLDGRDPATFGTTYTGPFTVSTTSTVRAIATDNAGNTSTLSQTITVGSSDTTPPSLAIACNGTTCSSSTYSSAVTVTLTASDASGIREIRYSLDGSDPIGGTIYTAPFTVSATATVRAIATDNAGNTTTLSQTITIANADTTPPTLAISCNGTTCSSSAYSSAVTVTLTASDAGGIRDIRYTTNGTDPATSGTVYTAPFTVSATSTVRAIATDNAGNTTTLSQTITIASADTTPPTLAITCNGGGCSSTFTTAVTVALTASDASGIRDIRYTTNGTDPATSGTVYSAPFTVSSTSTVRAIATDNAGNTTTLSQTITISSASTNLLQNASLEIDSNGDQIPDCWKTDYYGTNTRTYTLTSDAYAGSRAMRLDITSFSSGGARLASAQDSGACAPAATPGRTYTVTAYYKSNVAPKFSVYYRNSSGSWSWLAESSSLPTSTTYRQATYTTPPLPAGATHISIGLSIFAAGSITTDAYTLVGN